MRHLTPRTFVHAFDFISCGARKEMTGWEGYLDGGCCPLRFYKRLNPLTMTVVRLDNDKAYSPRIVLSIDRICFGDDEFRFQFLFIDSAGIDSLSDYSYSRQGLMKSTGQVQFPVTFGPTAVWIRSGFICFSVHSVFPVTPAECAKISRDRHRERCLVHGCRFWRSP